MSLSLDAPVTALAGMGPRRGPLLKQKGIETLEDLLYYLPFRYENRIRFTPIGELRPGVVTCVQAEVLTAGLVRYRRSRRRAFHAALGQGERGPLPAGAAANAPAAARDSFRRARA